jgi:hypothetical protein
MTDNYKSLVAAYRAAEKANRSIFRINPLVGDEAFESVTLEGSSMFLEDGVLDYRASLLLRVVVASEGEVSTSLRHPQGELENLVFKETSEASNLTFTHDIAEVCRESRCEVDSHLKLVDQWIRSYLVNLGKLELGEKPRYLVAVSDKPSFDEGEKWGEFAYVWEENNEVSSEHKFNEEVLETAFGDFLEAVNEAVSEADSNRHDSTETEAADDLANYALRAFEYFGAESGDCSRIDYLFSDGEFFDVVASFEDGGDLPLFKWYLLALEENACLSANESWSDDSIASSGESVTYWTKQPEKAKEFMDGLFEEDAETFRTMAELVRKSVAGGKSPKWLIGSD